MSSVIIIGAGVAGITSAATFSKAGFTNFRIFESFHRYGGRLEKYHLTDTISVNLGANWMSGDRNPILGMIKENPEVKTHLDFDGDKDVKVLNENFEDISDEYKTYLESFVKSMKMLEEIDSPELISMDEGLKRFTDYEEPKSEYLKKALEYIDGYEAISGTSFSLTSMADLNENAMEKEIGIDPYMTSDTSACIPVIAERGNFDLEKIELNKTVISITKKKNFEIRFADGSTVNADHVICTIPISQYQQEKIKIDFMTERKMELFNCITFAHFANCWVLLDEEQEEQINKDMFIYLPTSPTQPFRSVEVCWPNLHHHNRKILVFRTVGNNCIQFNKMSREEVEESLQSTIKKSLGFSPKILNFSQPKWSQIPQFLGCYTNAAICPGMTGPEFYDELRSSISENFHFAGEAFDFDHVGYVTAAYKTAIAASNLVLEKVNKK